MEIKCLGFYTNPQRQELLHAVCEAASKAERLGFSCTTAEAYHGAEGLKCFEEKPPDLILAFGGDGTILRAARDALRFHVPVCGVNMGRIGFLSEAGFDELEKLLLAIKNNAYSVYPRMLLQCSVNEAPALYCLNDAQLYKKSYSGVIGIHVNIDGEDTGLVYADGVVVSTPTGATGYSISAGGPVIAPGFDAALITPICPHSLTYRPIVVAPSAQIVISVDEEAKLAVDGNHAGDIDKNDVIRITRAEEEVGFVQIEQRNFFTLIRDRLS